MIKYNTTPAVQEISKINISGNIIPEMWYLNLRKITKRDNTPYFEAIIILSEIIYWYKWKELRDEDTGMVVSYDKKFKSDILQKSYKDLANKFGLKKNTVKKAIDYLVHNNVINREFRTIHTKTGMPLSNVMYVEPIPETIKKITFNPPELLNKKDNIGGQVATLPPESRGTLPPESRGTYTKTTNTKITLTENTYSFFEREKENFSNESLRDSPLKNKDEYPVNDSLYKEPDFSNENFLRMCIAIFNERGNFIYDFMNEKFYVHPKIKNKDKYLSSKLEKFLDMFPVNAITQGVTDVMITDPGIVYEKYVRNAIAQYVDPQCKIFNNDIIYICSCGHQTKIDTDEVGDCEYCDTEIDHDIINDILVAC